MSTKRDDARRFAKMSMNRMSLNKVGEVKNLSLYLYGFSTVRGDERLEKAAEWLDKLSDHICGQGHIGCRGGPECSSDHK